MSVPIVTDGKLKQQQRGNLTYFYLSEFPAAHGFFARVGGISQAPYSALNTAFKTADPHAAANRRILLDAAGIANDPVYVLNPCHGEQIAHIETCADSNGGERVLKLTEAALTRCRNVWFLISSADCLILLLTDQNRSFMGMVHLGWKNIVAGFIFKVLAEIQNRYRIDPQELIIGLSPCIYPCCYVFETPSQLSIPFWQPFLQPLGKERYAIDLVSALKSQLSAAAIPAANFHEAHVCTGCHTDLFFSAYQEGYVSGRFPTLVGLKDGLSGG